MPETLENRMVVDWQWPDAPAEVVEKLNGAGYRDIKSGTFIPEEDAFEYAMEHCATVVPPGFYEIEWAKEFREMVVEWYFSGGWYCKEESKYVEKL